MSRIPEFRELLGNEGEFFATYHNRQPLLRRGALSGDPRDVLSIADVDGIIASEAVRPPYLDIAKGGNQVVRKLYTEPMGLQGEQIVDRVLPDQVAKLFRIGATICLNGLNHFRPNLRALARDAAERFASPVEVIGFLTPPGHRGLAPHRDSMDVYVVQLEGTKTWKVWATPEQHPWANSEPVKEELLGEPVIHTTLEPGDMLYMPRNSPHVAMAEDRVSLHLSVSVFSHRWAELLRDVVVRVVAQEPAFWDVPLLTTTDHSAAELGKALGLLADRLAQVDLDAEVARLVAESPGTAGLAQPTFLSDVAAADALEPGSLVALSGPPPQMVEADGGSVRLSVDGAVYAFPREIHAAIQQLASSAPIPAGAFLTGATEDHSTDTARQLIHMGVLRPAR